MSPEHLWNVWTGCRNRLRRGGVGSAVVNAGLRRARRGHRRPRPRGTGMPGRRSADSASRSDRAGLGVIALVVAVVGSATSCCAGTSSTCLPRCRGGGSPWPGGGRGGIGRMGRHARTDTTPSRRGRGVGDQAYVDDVRSAPRHPGSRRGRGRHVGVVVVFGRMSTASDPGLAAHVAGMCRTSGAADRDGLPAGPTASRSSRARSRSPPASCSPCIATPCGRTPMERGSTSNVRAVPTSLATSWRWGSEPFWSRSAACFTWRDRLR